MLAPSCRGVSRRTVFAGLVALSASGLPARAQTKPRRFAVAIPNTKRLYYKRMLTGMSGAAASLGIELHVEEYAYDVKKELLVVEALSQQGFDGYIVVSVGTEGAEAELAGILQKIPAPFATVGYRILGAAVTVLPDWRSAGTLQAQLATKFAPAGSTLLYLTSRRITASRRPRLSRSPSGRTTPPRSFSQSTASPARRRSTARPRRWPLTRMSRSSRQVLINWGSGQRRRRQKPEDRSRS